MKRLFIAIEVPEHVKDLAVTARQTLKLEASGARWIPPENVHMTLKFLGACDDGKVDAVISGLESAAKRSFSFIGRTTHLGVFPNPRKARIVWLGMEKTDDLARVHKEVDSAMFDIGFDPDDRPFHPHITLARIKRPAPFDIDGAGRKIETTHEFHIDALTLFSSRLTPEGARYEVIARAKLPVYV